MNKVLKKRPVAILITIVAICLSTLFSIQRTLGAECKAVTDGFFTGVYYDGYAHSSVNSHLMNSAAAANGLLTITWNYGELSDASVKLAESRAVLLNILKTENVGEISAANQSMKAAFSELNKALSLAELSERDAEGAKLYTDNFNNAQGAIASSKYNETVREFYRGTIAVFPTNILSRFAGINLPELFE